jgi:hypothetical protein
MLHSFTKTKQTYEYIQDLQGIPKIVKMHFVTKNAYKSVTDLPGKRNQILDFETVFLALKLLKIKIN